ncbi:MAG: inorganic pyrophosphatase Ppa [Deltaproteobacteria bacterium]|nr:inorganic pyrophosphatase Ppa [Deltaproteobacteria bacterium]
MEPVAVIEKYQLEPYRGSPERLRKLAVQFTGSPRNSPITGKVLLLNDPASSQAFYYEFLVSDIMYGEEAPSLSLPDGSTVSMVHLWIKKGATALKVVPFHVQDTAVGLRSFFEDR